MNSLITAIGGNIGQKNAPTLRWKERDKLKNRKLLTNSITNLFDLIKKKNMKK